MADAPLPRFRPFAKPPFCDTSNSLLASQTALTSSCANATTCAPHPGTAVSLYLPPFAIDCVLPIAVQEVHAFFQPKPVLSFCVSFLALLNSTLDWLLPGRPIFI